MIERDEWGFPVPTIQPIGKPLVYMAGPYTEPDPVENIHRAIKIADDLWGSGLVTPVVPHLSGFWHLVTPRPYEEWLEYDLQLMRRCDAVYRFPGESSGADNEVKEATSLLPVFYEKEHLLNWAKSRTWGWRVR